MSAWRCGIAIAALMAGGSGVTGCSSPSGSTAAAQASHNLRRASVSAASMYQSPEQATLSWFSAINHKDQPSAVAHFEPSAAGMMSWYGGPSAWPTFSALRCRQISGGGTTATVLCTFKESQAPSVGQPDNFWTVELQRQPDGRWLITNYGSG
jgi:hypothetical protein